MQRIRPTSGAAGSGWTRHRDAVSPCAAGALSTLALAFLVTVSCAGLTGAANVLDSATISTSGAIELAGCAVIGAVAVFAAISGSRPPVRRTTAEGHPSGRGPARP